MVDHLMANWIAFALAAALLVGVLYYTFRTHRTPEIAHASEHMATLVRLTQMQGWKGQGDLVYVLKLDDGRIATISSPDNHFVQVGTRVPIIELKTVNGGTMFKFKDP